jgi:PAS domain-containing protein
MFIPMTLPFGENALRALLAQLPDGVVVTDANGQFIYVSEIADRMMSELTPIAADGSWPLGEVVGSVRRPLVIDRAVTRAVLIGDEVRDEEVACMTRDDRRRWLSVSATPIRDATGRVEAVVVTSTDITARKECDELAPLLRSLARL